ncbi:MAG TPA: methylated-DNA--[protein]-cysteine S-methyltransferase [Candidatus Limnocylindria bacterium]|nr:methylated-DNA--[protein]-cysteine S-methyltransferase [Candidatus Limnocylindria bacterium]
MPLSSASGDTQPSQRACAPLHTPIGRLWITVSPAGLVAVSRGDLPPQGATLYESACEHVMRELRAYFDGRLRTFSVALDLTDVTAFDGAVYRAARTIPYGETASYGDLALMAGHPRAARAVGGAMARCPYSPVVPCHRVIHADGSIGGWGSQPWTKRWLLDLERGAAPAPRPGPAGFT